VGGTPKEFKSMQVYLDYNKATGCPDVSGRRNSTAIADAMKVPPTPFAYFKEFRPENPYQQALYSAMSPIWVGRSSDAAKVYH
jgi:hypothetical protein